MRTETDCPPEPQDPAARQELYETLVAISVVARQLARDTLCRGRPEPGKAADRNETQNQLM